MPASAGGSELEQVADRPADLRLVPSTYMKLGGYKEGTQCTERGRHGR